MALKLRTQIHPFQTTYDDSVIEQNSIENIFKSLHTDTDIRNAVILVEDNPITDNFDQIPEDGSRIYIRIIPQGSDASTEDVGKGMTWGGIGVIVAGVAIAAFAGWTGVGAMAGFALIGTGISMTIGGVVVLNTDFSSPSGKSRTSPTQDPSLKGSSNQERQYGSIPVILGRHLLSPDIAAKTYTEVRNITWSIKYEIVGTTVIFTLINSDGITLTSSSLPLNTSYSTASCYGLLYITDSNSYSENNYIGTVSKEYRQIGVLDHKYLWARLRGFNDKKPVWLSDPYCFPNPLYTYKECLVQLLSLGYNNATVEKSTLKLGDTLLTEYSSSKNIDAILSGEDELVQAELITDGSASKIYPKVCHEKQLNAVIKKTNDTGSSGSIIQTTANNTTSINVDIFFLTGLFRYSGSDVVNTTVEIKAWYKKDGAAESEYVLLKDWNLTYRQTSTLRLTATVDGLAAGKYTVKFERITDDHDDDTTVYDTCYAGSIRAYTDDRPVTESRQKKLTVLALKMLASDVTTENLNTLNCIVQSKVPDYTGTGSGSTAWISALTKNPASLVLYVLRGQINCTPVSDEDIDWPAFETWWSFCNTHKMFCNAVLSDDLTISELYNKIAMIGRGTITKIDGKFSVVIDCAKAAPVQLFSPRNTTDYQKSLVMADIPDEIDYKFVDETDDTFSENSRPVYNTPLGTLVTTPASRQETTVWGITSPEQVFKYARYQYAVLTNRRAVHKISCDIEYIMCGKGDLIEYAGDTALTGVAYGRVKELIYDSDGATVKGIVSDTILPFNTTDDYGIRIRRSNGKLIRINCQNTGTSERFCYFDETITEINMPEPGDLFSFGIRGKETLELIITDISPGENETAELTCVDYSPEIFGVDDDDYAVPEFENKLTLGGVADTGIKSIDSWKTFTTYSDDVDVTSPTGDGNSGGWHTYETSNSLWKSTKNAQSATDGVWGDPLPTVMMIASTGVPGVTPATASALTAAAGADRLSLSCTWEDSGLAGTVRNYVWAIKKQTDLDWDTAIQLTSSGSSADYFFNRKTDGYPEKDGLAEWTVRVKIVSIYGESSVWSSPVAINTDSYGTWLVGTPVVSASVTGRSVILTLAQPESSLERYGNIRYQLFVRKPSADADDAWYKPNLAADPYGALDNYKDGSGYAIATAQFSQSLPLDGQTADVPAPVNTTYQYKIIGYNEASGSTAATATVVALATGARDIAAATITENKIATGAVTADKIHAGTITGDKIAATNLAANGAVLGQISGNAIGTSSANYWIGLDTNTPEFRIGNDPALESSGSDSAVYFHFKWIDGIASLVMKLNNFILTSLASIVVGVFRVKATGATNLNSFVTINPESTADSTTGTPAKTVQIQGDATANNFVGNLKGSATLTSLNYTWKDVDLSSLDTNYYYPVLLYVDRLKVWNTIGVCNTLDSNVPSWSTHPAGFTALLEVKIQYAVWGTTDAHYYITEKQTKFANAEAVGFSYLVNSSAAVLWLRGGGIYHCYNDNGSGFEIHTESFTVANQTVAPTTNYIFEVNRPAIYTNINGNSTTADNATTASHVPVVTATPANPDTGQEWLNNSL